MNIHEIMEAVEKMCHENNCSMIFAIEDANGICSLHICNDVTDATMVNTLKTISEINNDRLQLLIYQQRNN